MCNDIEVSRAGLWLASPGNMRTGTIDNRRRLCMHVRWQTPFANGISNRPSGTISDYQGLTNMIRTNVSTHTADESRNSTDNGTCGTTSGHPLAAQQSTGRVGASRHQQQHDHQVTLPPSQGNRGPVACLAMARMAATAHSRRRGHCAAAAERWIHSSDRRCSAYFCITGMLYVCHQATATSFRNWPNFTH
eukprot:6188004-Pleurochrysis_carterae.AAC.4